MKRESTAPRVVGVEIIQDISRISSPIDGFLRRMRVRAKSLLSDGTRTDTYVMDWWDTLGMGRSEYRGKFSGSKLVLESATPMGRSRATYDLSKEGAYDFAMEVSMDGNNWATFMKGSYRRLA